ncbi:MAG: hypothetical protein ACD_37C00070G0002 [uncultured bacterium]|nr:MAG: hypothetical protein ACD_37C00070G0002 [uncultured bacterium]
MNVKFIRFIRFIAFLSLFTLVVFLSLFEINDADTIQYLASGKYIVEHGLPQGCVFTYTTQHCEMVYPEWLFHVIVYSVYRVGNWVGLGLFQLGLNCLIFGIILLYNYKRKYSFLSLSVFFLLGLIVASDRSKLRADLPSLLFSTLLFIILESFINKSSVTKQKIILFYGGSIFFLMMLWANIHGSFPLGYFVIGVFIFDRLLTNLKSRFVNHKKTKILDERAKILSAFFILSLIGSFINPFGLKSYILPYRFLIEARHINYISEFQSPFIQVNSPRFSLVAFKIMESIGLILIVLSIRVTLARHMLLYITFLILSIQQVRNLGYFAIISMLILPYYGDYFLRRVSVLFTKYRNRFIIFAMFLGNLGRLSMILFTVVFIYLIVTQKYYFFEKRSRRFGFGLSQIVFPLNAVEFIKKNNLQGNVFNSYSFGSIINWSLYPAYKSSIHGHLSDPLFFNYYSRVLNDPLFYKEAVEKYKIKTFFLNYAEPNTFLLVRYLYSDPDWKLVYLDPTTVIFVANIAEHSQVIKEHAIDLKTYPLDKPFAFYKNITKVDLITMHSQIATFYYNFGLYEKALVEYQKALTENPQNFVLMTNLGRTYVNLKKYDEGENILTSALKRNTRYDVAHFFLARIYQIKEEYGQALEEYSKTLKYNPKYKEAHFSIGEIYLQMGNIFQARREFEEELFQNPNHALAREALQKL